MKAITSIFESILRDNNDLVWTPEDVEPVSTGMLSASTWTWGG